MPPLKREKDIPIPAYARDFVKQMNDDRVQRGDLPLSEEQIENVIEHLRELKQKY